MSLTLIDGGKNEHSGLSPQQVEQAFSDYYRPIFNYLYYRTLNRALAEDLTSDVFMRVVRARKSYDPAKANIETWIFRIARNRLFDHFRSDKPTSDIDQIAEGAFAANDSYDALDDTRQAAHELLKLLSDEERELVYLKYWREMSNKEIAEFTGMNASTVSTKLSRALAKMRKA